MKSKTKKWIVFASIIAVVLLCDMLTKNFIYGVNPKFLDGFISFFSIENPGAAWGLFAGKKFFLVIITITFLLALIIVNRFIKKRNTLYVVSVALIYGGALGNLYDRIVYGYVRDFIKLDFMSFPIFNVADMCLCVGIFLLCIFILFVETRGSKKAN